MEKYRIKCSNLPDKLLWVYFALGYVWWVSHLSLLSQFVKSSNIHVLQFFLFILYKLYFHFLHNIPVTKAKTRTVCICSQTSQRLWASPSFLWCVSWGMGLSCVKECEEIIMRQILGERKRQWALINGGRDAPKVSHSTPHNGRLSEAEPAVEY